METSTITIATEKPPRKDVLTSPARAGKIHLDYLDGLRGLAALFVVAHHIRHTYTKVPLSGIAGFCSNWLLHGHLSVDLFIVLSGFCLMLPVVRSRTLRGGWRTFYQRRAWRILPPLYAAIVLAILWTLFRHATVEPSAILANFLLVQDLWTSQNTVDGPLWSVAVEWKIYFLFPVLVWIWLRSGPAVVLLTAGALSVFATGAVRLMPFVEDRTHACPWYIFLFAMGAMAAHLATDPATFRSLRVARRTLLGAAIVLAVMLHSWPITAAGERQFYNPHLPAIDTAAGLVGALALALLGRAALANRPSRALAGLSWKPLVFVGTMAYSLYLIHILFIYFVKAKLVAHWPFLPPLLVIAIDMAVTVGVAYLFHLAFERPFMSSRAPRTERQAAAVAAVNPAP